MTGTVLIAGAGLAGSRVAEALRDLGHDGRVVLAGDEPHAPYERPALSKELLAGVREDASLRPATHWPELGIELRLGAAVTDVDPSTGTARLGREELAWDALVVATGARPRTIPGPAGVHTLRTLADAEAIRSEVDENARLVVVGAGFVGAEVASTLLPRASP